MIQAQYQFKRFLFRIYREAEQKRDPAYYSLWAQDEFQMLRPKVKDALAAAVTDEWQRTDCRCARWYYAWYGTMPDMGLFS